MTTVQERIRRYPSVEDLSGPNIGNIILDTNPPDVDSWLYRRFEIDRPPQHIIFKQPPGLIKNETGNWITNPGADNLKFIEKDWYIFQSYGKSEEQIKVQILGQYGSYEEGKPVYTGYNDDLHSVDSIDFLEHISVGIGFDYGLTPSAIFVQRDSRGRLLIIKELCAQDIGLEQFLTNQVIPFIKETIPNHELISRGDPAGSQRSQADEKTCQIILHEFGITTYPAKTNALNARLGAVQFFLNKLIQGKSAFLLSRKGCPMLRAGFNGKYKLRRERGCSGDVWNEPEKNEYSHPHDALQYIAMYYSSEYEENTKPFKTHMSQSGVLC